jgi:O-antigen/teichoic acid export membrane protein
MSLAALAIGILNTIDRLLIGSRISPAAVAAFALPHSLVSRIILIPHSLGSALFPRFAYLPASEHRALLTASVQAVAVLTSPITIVLIAVSEPFFTIWIGPELTRISAPLAHILAVGFWAYCVGYPAFSMLQAIGRPDLVAKLHLFELPLFAAGIVGAIYFFGLTGAALALTLRFVFETSILFRLVATSRAAARLLAAPALLVVGAAVAASELQGVLRYGILAVLLLACLLWSFLNIPPVLRPYTDRVVGLIRRGRERMSRQV